MCCGLAVAGACAKHRPCYWSQTDITNTLLAPVPANLMASTSTQTQHPEAASVRPSKSVPPKKRKRDEIYNSDSETVSEDSDICSTLSDFSYISGDDDSFVLMTTCQFYHLTRQCCRMKPPSWLC